MPLRVWLIAVAFALPAFPANAQLLNLECRSRGPQSTESHVYWVDYAARTITDVLAAPANPRAMALDTLATYPVAITDQAFTFTNNGKTVTINRVTGENTIPLEGYTQVLHCTRGDIPLPRKAP
jgi:hypothetical protein